MMTLLHIWTFRKWQAIIWSRACKSRKVWHLTRFMARFFCLSVGTYYVEHIDARNRKRRIIPRREKKSEQKILFFLGEIWFRKFVSVFFSHNRGFTKVLHCKLQCKTLVNPVFREKIGGHILKIEFLQEKIIFFDPDVFPIKIIMVMYVAFLATTRMLVQNVKNGPG